MAGGGAGELHRRVGGEAAIEGRAEDGLPAFSGAANFNHRAAMCGNFGERDFAREAGGIVFAHAGEHQVGRGVFVVDAKEAARRAVRIRIKRDEADKVVVVAELARLRGGGLVSRVESGTVSPERVAPAQQEVGAVAFGDMMGLVEAARDFREAEGGRWALHFVRGGGRSIVCAARAGGEREARDGREPAEKAAPGEAAFDDVGDGFGAGRDAGVYGRVL